MALTKKQESQLLRIVSFVVNSYSGKFIIEFGDVFSGATEKQDLRKIVNGTDLEKVEIISLYKTYLEAEATKDISSLTNSKTISEDYLTTIQNDTWE